MGYDFPHISNCLIRNSRTLRTFLSHPGARSPIMQTLISKMAYCCVLNYPIVAVERCLGQKPSVRPVSIVMGCDGSGDLERLMWSTWSFSAARGNGIFHLDNCLPSCATGTFHNYHVSVHFNDAVFEVYQHAPRWVWDAVEINFLGESPHGMQKVLKFQNFAPQSSGFVDLEAAYSSQTRPSVLTWASTRLARTR